MTMFEYESSDNAMSKDALFLERLDTFMDKCLIDIKAFAERELRPYQETRRCIAQWHAKYLFQSLKPSLSSSSSAKSPDRSFQVRDVLCDASRVLESLSEVAGVQSFLLAVDPSETSDSGFLGGSVIGREFWRGLRGGGEGGARALKTFSINHLQHQPANRNIVHAPKPSTPPIKGGPAKSLKNELYESVRNALRSASGVRSAEMKWTNPERLDMYGVRLVGWPEGVPSQNPSTFKVSQNKILLEALQNGSMRFEKITSANPTQAVEEGSKVDEDDSHEDFSWAYDVDASPPPSHAEYSATLLHSPPRQSLNTGQNPTLPVHVDETDSGNMSWTSTLDTDSAYSVNYLWAGDFTEPTDDLGWDDESETDSRPRKRRRSEENRII